MAIGLVLVVFATGTLAVLGWLRSTDDPVVVERCAAELDGTSWYLDPEQADNAALIAAIALQRNLPARATTIALATALQESGLRNLTYGDRDSLGLFQQRPSQGWGTEAEVQDPVYATNAFLDALVQLDGYQNMEITEAAQAVQRSAYPEAYAQHEARSRAWASALHGYSPAAVTCQLRASEPVASSEVVARIERDLALIASTGEATDSRVEITLQADGVPGGAEEPARLGWAVSQWAVAVADPLGVVEIRVADQTWQRTSDGWVPTTAEPVAAGAVVLVLNR